MSDERTPTAEPVTALAADIRAVDGNHDLGASALAEALIERGWSQRSTAEVERLREALLVSADALDAVGRDGAVVITTSAIAATMRDVARAALAEPDHEGEITVRLGDKRQTCECGHRYGVHATGGTQCLAAVDRPGGFCYCQRWVPAYVKTGEADPAEPDHDDSEYICDVGPVK